MILMHIADLHLGKKVCGFSMIEDQKYILKNILNIVKTKKVEGVIIAGDVYDKSIPAIEATILFDDFLMKLSKLHVEVYIISGNHDSMERLSFGNSFFKESKIYFSPIYNGDVSKITVNDKYGPLNIYLLPFLKPVNVSKFFEDESIESYTDACKVVINNLNVNSSERNILVAHQFITGGVTSDSENISVGGSDNVDANIFEDFDYVALGHLHRAQKIMKDTIRYSGSPLKYSFSEVNHNKSVTIIEINSKSNVEISFEDLIPLRDLVEIKGLFSQISSKDFYSKYKRDDYYHITLLDEEDIPDVINKLREIFPNIMTLDYLNSRTKNNNDIDVIEDVENKTPKELYEKFFKVQNNIELNSNQSKILSDLIEKIWGEE